MTYLLPGIVIGSVWAIMASGLVMTYRTTGVLNLGYGSVAYALAEVFFNLRSEQGWPGWLAALVVVCVVAPLLALVLWGLIFRKLEGAGVVATLVSTIGLAIALPALVRFALPHDRVFVAPGIFDNGGNIKEFWGITLTVNQLSCVIGAALCCLALGAGLQFTKGGLVMRAVVNRPAVAQLMAANTAAASAISWVIGTMLAALGGILLAPVLLLESSVFVELTVASLSVALVAGLRRLGVVYVAAIVLGSASTVLTQFMPSGSVLATGLRPGISFAVIVLVLLLRRASLTTALERPAALSKRVDFSVRNIGIGVSGAAVATAIVVLVATSYWQGAFALGLIYTLIFLGFTVTLGRSGVLPLGQAALVGIGGFSTGHLFVDRGMPFLLALIVGGLVAAVIGGLLAVIGMKLGVLEFGLLTLAFAVFCDQVLFRMDDLVPLVGYTFTDVHIFGIEIVDESSILILCAVIVTLAALAIAFIQSRVIGLNLEALELNSDAAEHTGVPVRRYRVMVFMLGAFFAGVGGALLGVYQRHLGGADVATFTGLIWLAVLVTFGRRSFTAALFAGLVYSIFPTILRNSLALKYGEVPAILFGLGGLALASDPRGVVAAWRDGGITAWRRWTSSRSSTSTTPTKTTEAPTHV